MGLPNAITRRDFLKSSALGAAAALTPASLAQTTSSATSKAERAQRLLTGWEYFQGALGGPWDIWRRDAGGAVLWHPVQLPHCFNARDAVDPDQPCYQGPGWYRSRLKVANPFPSGRTLLHFEGAGQKSKVFVYLDQLGEHIGGYDEFVVDITEAAGRALKNPENKGEVPIAVLCDNSRDLEMIPSSLSDFNRYGGLYRYVNLVYVPALSLEGVLIESAVQAKQPAKVSIKARLYNPESLNETARVSLRVLDPKGATIYRSNQALTPWKGEGKLATFDIKSPQLWSPSHPALYRCEVTLASPHGEMNVTERFGLRHFEFVAHGPFKLNGERLLIRGTHRHEDHALLGAAMPEELIRKEMKLIKEMGANFIRLGHYQQSRIVLDCCDELGLLVWEEIPWCRGGLGGERYQQQARNMLRNVIDQHYNHPSVIIWGLGNENDWPGDLPEFDKEKIRAFMKELNDQAHALDPSRKTAIRRCEFCKDIVDVYSPSIWAGWYRGRYTEYKSSSQSEMEKVNHFLHMEWGGDSHARRHSEDPDRVLSKIATGQGTDERGLDYLLTGGQERASRDGDWSETYICNLFDWHLKEQETKPWLTGAAQWIFKDFSTPGRPDNPIPRVNQKGLVERDLTPKEGYYVFQSYWGHEPMVRIYGHSWPVRWGDADELKMVKVYSNCDSAELLLNNASCGAKKRKSQDFPAAGLRWSVKFKSGENHLRVIGRKNGATVTDEIRFHYQIDRWQKPARLVLRETARQDETVTVEARLLDANDILCLDARNPIRFGITGDGTLLDNVGTNRGSRALELYNGRAEISLQRRGGKSVVSVSSKSIPTAFLPVT
jgi:beta-galactosidase